MQLIGLAPWILLCVLLAAYAPKIRTAFVGWILVMAGIAVFAVRLHHEGAYPFPGAMDLTSGCSALLLGVFLIADRLHLSALLGVFEGIDPKTVGVIVLAVLFAPEVRELLSSPRRAR